MPQPIPSVSYFQGQWRPLESISLSVNDAGFRFGVVAVERLRTYNRQVFAATSHVQRFLVTTRELGIAPLPDQETIEALIVELLKRNGIFDGSHADTGITMFATPGCIDTGEPTFALHLNPLDHDRIQRLRTLGQSIVVTDVSQQPDTSWPRFIKTRCRLHYYLADRQARSIASDAVGILIDDDGSLTETSIANLAIVEAGRIVSPPPARILPGVTQAVVEPLAKTLGIEWLHQPISARRLYEASEVLLMGTDAGLWFARQLFAATGERHGKHLETPGPLFRRLLESFDEFTTKGHPSDGDWRLE